MILGKYQFHYPLRNITQVKTLITHDTYLIGYAIEDKDERKAYFKQYGEWFTDRSPLYDAIDTGIIYCNGVHQCTVTRIDKPEK